MPDLAYSSLRLRSTLLAALLGIAPPSGSQADYRIALLSEDRAERVVRIGEEFALDVALTSNAQDQHWAVEIRVEFSSSGLSLARYAWSFPFVNGGQDDASIPAFATLPMIIRADSLPNGPALSNRVDVFFSNFTTDPQGYRIGRLLRLWLAVPADYVGLEQIQIQIVSQSFGDGFNRIPAQASEPFSLRILPAEGQARPSLAVGIEHGLVSLTWPASIQGAVLQTTTDLTGEWADLPEVPRIVEGRNQVQLFAATGARPAFFRLRFP